MDQKQQRQGQQLGEIAKLKALHHHSTRLPDNWRDRLPDPADYYRQHVAKLGRSNGSGWAQGVSPFRDEREPSFSVCQSNPRGPWRDFATGETGDLVSFHMRLTGKPFKEAVADLLAGVRR
ncbi:CHC2 zinc finger domain-containing protein [Xanthomonas albilineans]|uniref:CHC2 zinc finger domain-containing protein n=1 Tax=Xanthomonas albilineans TaxID=29447 RepID=UPI0005F34FD1|nr:CHC2 zinc finger domain-containing protein [Xanthomonas albilineans]